MLSFSCTTPLYSMEVILILFPALGIFFPFSYTYIAVLYSPVPDQARYHCLDCLAACQESSWTGGGMGSAFLFVQNEWDCKTCVGPAGKTG